MAAGLGLSWLRPHPCHWPRLSKVVVPDGANKTRPKHLRVNTDSGACPEPQLVPMPKVKLMVTPKAQPKLNLNLNLKLNRTSKPKPKPKPKPNKPKPKLNPHSSPNCRSLRGGPE